MKIRTINADELSQAVDLHVKPGEPRFITEFGLRGLHGKKEAMLLGAYSDQVLVGMIAIEPPEGDLRRLAYLGVSPHMQKTGVATALLQRALQIIDQEGNIAGLNVRKSDNQARSLYEGLGFEVKPQKFLTNPLVMRRPHPDALTL